MSDGRFEFPAPRPWRLEGEAIRDAEGGVDFLHQDIGYTILKPSCPLTLGPRRITCVKKEVFLETGDKNACFASVMHLSF